MPDPDSASRTQPPRRRTRRRAVLLILLAGLAVVHVPLLRGAAGRLISSDVVPQQGQLLLLGGDRCYEVAAERYRRGDARSILTIEGGSRRLKQLGVIPTSLDLSRQALEQRGVPAGDVQSLSDNIQSDWQLCAALLDWLQQHPEESVVVLRSEFGSRSFRRILDEALGPEKSRVAILPLPDRRYGVDNWWTTRTGGRAFVIACIRAADDWLRGREEQSPRPEWDPDEYETALAKRLAGEPDDSRRENSPSGWLPAAVQWLDVGTDPRPTQYMVVLPGDESVRPFVAAALYQAGLAEILLVPETVLSPQQQDGIALPTHEVVRRVLMLRGVPEEKIILMPPPSNSTGGDAVASLGFLRDVPDDRIMVVTSHYHTRRARMAFADVFRDQGHEFSFVSAPTDDFDAGDWWQSKVGTVQIQSEFVKLSYYWVRHANGGYWLAAGGLVCVGLWVWRRRSRQSITQVPRELAKVASREHSAVAT